MLAVLAVAAAVLAFQPGAGASRAPLDTRPTPLVRVELADAGASLLSSRAPFVCETPTGRFELDAVFGGSVVAIVVVEARGSLLLRDAERVVEWKGGEPSSVFRAGPRRELVDLFAGPTDVYIVERDLDVWPNERGGITSTNAVLQYVHCASLDAPWLDGIQERWAWSPAIHALAVTAAGDVLIEKRGEFALVAPDARSADVAAAYPVSRHDEVAVRRYVAPAMRLATVRRAESTAAPNAVAVLRARANGGWSVRTVGVDKPPDAPAVVRVEIEAERTLDARTGAAVCGVPDGIVLANDTHATLVTGAADVELPIERDGDHSIASLRAH